VSPALIRIMAAKPGFAAILHFCRQLPHQRLKA